MSPTGTLALTAVIFSTVASRLATAQVVSSGEPKALATYAPRPEYPQQAREKRMMGRAVAIVNVDTRTGEVKSAQMESSTGHRILDDAALTAFRQWKFKPGGVSNVKIPIRFAFDTHRALAVYAARPLYPVEARSKRFTGAGIVLVDVDQTTGAVTSARMLRSTGHQILDDAALTAFRQWRFRPGTVREVRIPITYTMRGVRY